jgi:hypothetical protein
LTAKVAELEAAIAAAEADAFGARQALDLFQAAYGSPHE